MQPDRLPGVTDAAGPRHDLHVGRRQGRQHRVAHPEQLQRLRLGPGAAGHRLHAAEPRRAVLARARASRTRWRRASVRCTPSSRPSWRRTTCKIGFGIMGGWNQGQAHAQFVSNIVDYGLTIQQALEAGRFTKGTFEGCDVDIEALVPEATRAALDRPRSRARGGAAAQRHLRLRPGGDERRRRRALRRLGAAARRRGDSAGAGGVRERQALRRDMKRRRVLVGCRP